MCEEVQVFSWPSVDSSGGGGQFCVSISRSNGFEAGPSFVVYLFSFEPQDILSHSSRSNLTPWHSFWLRYRRWVCLGVLISAVVCSRHSELVCFHIAEKLMVASVEKDRGSPHCRPDPVLWPWRSSKEHTVCPHSEFLLMPARLDWLISIPQPFIEPPGGCTMVHAPCPSYRDDNLVGTPENLCSIGTLLLPKQFVCVTPCLCFAKQC